jgi:hypothetical protein
MLDRLHRYSRLSLRHCCACAIAVLAISVAAQADPEGASGHNPDNVLTKQPDALETLQRLLQPGGAAMAAQRPAPERRVYRTRTARSKSKAVEPAAATEQAPAAPATALPDALSQPFWPNAQASAGMGDISPFIIRTVREMIETESSAVVLANELSDLDLAASAVPPSAPQVAPQTAPQTATDGRAPADTADSEPVAADSGESLGAMLAALKAAVPAQGPWIDSLLLMLAGALAALAALSAVRRLA